MAGYRDDLAFFICIFWLKQLISLSIICVMKILDFLFSTYGMTKYSFSNNIIPSLPQFENMQYKEREGKKYIY